MNDKSMNLKGVATLSFSMILVLFSASLMAFCDRLILAHFSITGLEAAMAALWLTQLFQFPIMRISSMAQAFVAQHKGAGQLALIGPCVWQMIWLSLMTMLITLPLSGPVGTWFFEGTGLQEGKTCFYFLMSLNFLFPLGAALSGYYLGQGETKKIIKTSLMSHGLHLLLDFPLVFGVSGVIPPLGALGSVLAALLSQLFFCTVIFLDFIQLKHHAYATRDYVFKLKAFWNYVRIGIPRGIARIVQLSAWVFITHMLIAKGSDYAAILVFGGTLYLFLSCFNEGLGQALITLGGNAIGAQKPFLGKLIRSAVLFLSLEWCVLTIPFLLFPEVIIQLFFKEQMTPLLHVSLLATCGWIWVLFLMEGLNYIGFGLLSAYNDTVFQMWFSLATWVTSVLPTYLFIHRANASPEWYWSIACSACLITAWIYFVRLALKKQSYRVGEFA